jgi:hypothetical protein
MVELMVELDSMPLMDLLTLVAAVAAVVVLG